MRLPAASAVARDPLRDGASGRSRGIAPPAARAVLAESLRRSPGRQPGRAGGCPRAGCCSAGSSAAPGLSASRRKLRSTSRSGPAAAAQACGGESWLQHRTAKHSAVKTIQRKVSQYRPGAARPPGPGPAAAVPRAPPSLAGPRPLRRAEPGQRVGPAGAHAGRPRQRRLQPGPGGGERPTVSVGSFNLQPEPAVERGRLPSP